MKKLLFTFVLVFVAFAVSAQGITKIYINPGHGGWDSDDRYQPLPPYGKVTSNLDTLAFWESSSNLDKGLILYHMLDSLNQIRCIIRRNQIERQKNSGKHLCYGFTWDFHIERSYIIVPQKHKCGGYKRCHN